MSTLRLPKVVAVFLAQFLGMLLLAAFGYWWLRWPDAHAWQVLLSFLFAVIWIFALVLLEWFTFTRYRAAAEGPMWRKLFTLLVVFVLLFIGLYYLEQFGDDAPRIGTRLAQLSHASPRTAIKVFAWFVLSLQLLWATLLLGLASIVSARGFAVFGRARLDFVQLLRTVRFWVGVGVSLAIAAYLSHVLIYQVPAPNSTLRAQAISAGVRFFVAYLICITAVVLVAWFTGDRRSAPQDSAPH